MIAMGIFGWSLPAGCGTLPGEEDEGPCLVCGNHIDDCICPECQECGDVGNPSCYSLHGLVRTSEQVASLAAAEERWANDCRNDPPDLFLDDY